MRIAEALSSQRLETYRLKESDSEQQLLSRYQWNVTLSESFYPALHFLEISLRNHVHAVIAQHLGESLWLSCTNSLHAREADQVRAAIATLRRQQSLN